MRVAVYLRQSQDRNNDELAISRQRDDVHRLLKARGWTNVVEFVDNDVSASSRKPRNGFNAMMTQVDAGVFDVIVARHMDRLLRRLSEFESVLERCTKTNTFIVTASDGVDTSTDGGRLVARILSSVAQGEVERKGARQRSAAIQAAQQGRWVGGRRAFGYEADGVTVRPNEAALIVQGYADVLAGESLAEVARRWEASGIPTTQGGRRWNTAAVKDILTNPRAAGLRRYRPAEDRWKIRQNPELGIVGKAVWPPIVDETTWRAACHILCDPKRYKPKNGGKGLLTGVAVCGECGEFVHRGGASHGKPMYRCMSGRHVSRLSEPVDVYVTEVVLERLARPDAQDLWSAELPDAADLMSEADTLRQELKAIDEDRMAQRIDRPRWLALNEATSARLTEVEAQIALAGSSSPLSIVAAEDVQAEWDGYTMAQRRNLIEVLVTPVLHLVGRGTRTFREETVDFHWHDT